MPDYLSKAERDGPVALVATPHGIQRLLRRCLQKDSRKRIDSAAVAAFEIEDALAGPAETPPPATGGRWREAFPWAIVAVLGAALLGTSLYLMRRPRPVASGSVRVEIPMPRGVRFNFSASLSPDARRVAFAGVSGAGNQVYLRELDQLDAYLLPNAGTSAARCFFSPDGREVGFDSNVDRVLQKVTLSSGVATPPLAREVNGTGSWGLDGELTFIRAGELWQVPARGGNPKQLTTLDRDKGEVSHLNPTAIGGGQVILFEVKNQRGESHIEAVSAATGARRVLTESGSQPLHASSGHLLYLQGTDLVAVPFDADRLKTTPPAVRVLQNVGNLFSVSSTGALLYAETDSRRLVWVSREGKPEPFGEARSDYADPALSPNGQHVVLDSSDRVWDQDLVHNILTPLTDGKWPVWTRDGTHVIVSTADGMKLIDADGVAPAQPVPGSIADDILSDVTSDGVVAYYRTSPDTKADIYLRYLDGRAPAQPPLQTPAFEGAPQFSPNGQWTAYVSDESGQMEIWCVHIPDSVEEYRCPHTAAPSRAGAEVAESSSSAAATG